MADEVEIVVDGVPFFSQLIERDPSSIAGPTDEEARHWSVRACGVACVRMLASGLAASRNEAFSKTTWELLKDGLSENAYNDRGWIHAGLLRLLGHYGISGECHRSASIEKIAKIVHKENVCIASVAFGLRGEVNDKNEIIGKGGHLIIINGVRERDGVIQSFRCHHPSSRAEWNWENAWIPVEKIERSFSGNLVEVNWRGGLSPCITEVPIRNPNDKIQQVHKKEI